MTRLCLLIAGCLLAGGPAVAQPPRFQLRPGDALTCARTQSTTVTETRPGDTLVVTMTATTRQRWAVTAVDAQGVATVDVVLLALRQEIKPAAVDGKPAEPIVVDSATPEGEAALKDVLNRVVMTIRLDATGKVIDVPEGQDPAGRLQVEVPFRVVWPDAPVAAGTTWTRPTSLTAAPPLGSGERLDLVQSFTLKTATPDKWVIGLTTAPATPPTGPQLNMALAPVLTRGDIYFQPQTGRYLGCDLTTSHTVADFAGPGTRFQYEATVKEVVE